VQLDPIKLKLKPPGTERLKLKCDVLHSTHGFKFNLRRYNMDECYLELLADPATAILPFDPYSMDYNTYFNNVTGNSTVDECGVGAYNRPLFDST